MKKNRWYCPKCFRIYYFPKGYADNFNKEFDKNFEELKKLGKENSYLYQGIHCKNCRIYPAGRFNSWQSDVHFVGLIKVISKK